MPCLGRAWDWQALLCSPQVSSGKCWSRNARGQKQKDTYRVKATGCPKKSSLNMVCWLNTNSDSAKSKISEDVTWVQQYFFLLPGTAQQMKIQLIGSFSVINTSCSSFPLWMMYPYFILTALLNVDLLLLTSVLNAIRFASWTCMTESSRHGVAFCCPSFWRCNINLSERRKSSGSSKRCLYTEMSKQEEFCSGHHWICMPLHRLLLATVHPSP